MKILKSLILATTLLFTPTLFAAAEETPQDFFFHLLKIDSEDDRQDFRRIVDILDSVDDAGKKQFMLNWLVGHGFYPQKLEEEIVSLLPNLLSPEEKESEAKNLLKIALNNYLEIKTILKTHPEKKSENIAAFFEMLFRGKLYNWEFRRSMDRGVARQYRSFHCWTGFMAKCIHPRYPRGRIEPHNTTGVMGMRFLSAKQLTDGYNSRLKEIALVAAMLAALCST